jgi:hypothetical protein
MNEAKAPQSNSIKTRKAKLRKIDTKPRSEIDVINCSIRLIYDSTSQIKRHFNEEPVLKLWLDTYCNYMANDHWMGGTFGSKRALECATGGLLDNVPLIKEERRKAEKLDVQVLFPTWEQDIAGAFPDVSVFLAGDPQAMRRMANQVSDTRPIRIFVGMASSYTFSAEQLAKRGALISALALQLSKTRTVDIYAINSGEKKFSKGALAGQTFDWSVMVKMPKPVSASDLSYWLCHQASVRGLLYSVERAFSGPLSWPSSLGRFAEYHSPEGIKAHARIWGAGEGDIVVPFPVATDLRKPKSSRSPKRG